MKSKAATYVLIPVVLAVWGVIVKKLFFVDPAPEASVPQQRTAVFVRDSVPDTLRLDYRDPFLGSNLPTAAMMAVQARIVKSLPQPLVPPEKITIRYLGRIGTPVKLFALIEQGGDQYTLLPGEELDGFRLVGFWPDSVRLSKGEHIYTVKIVP